MPRRSSHPPNWGQLFGIAAEQQGLFTTKQAAEAGYSPQLLAHYLQTGKVIRAQRGIYRLVHFPPGDQEDLVTAWLWSEQAGVLSHQTALALHGLSDVLPSRIHLSLPEAWRTRRVRPPQDLVLHYADVPSADWTWFAAVPTTKPQRSLNDSARAGLSPELLRQAAQQALRRGLVKRSELADVEAALEPFGGLAA